MIARVLIGQPDSQGRQQMHLVQWCPKRGAVTADVFDHPSNRQHQDFPHLEAATKAVERWAWQTKQPGAAPSDERQGGLFVEANDG